MKWVKHCVGYTAAPEGGSVGADITRGLCAPDGVNVKSQYHDKKPNH